MPVKTLCSLALALTLCAALAATATAKDMFEEEVDKETLAVKLSREAQKGGYPLVTAAELKALKAEGKPVLIVDTMPFADSYKKEHVPAALSFEFPIEPMDAWDTAKTGGKTQADFEKLLGADKARLIVFYCGFVKCTRSHNGAVWAKKLGYTNVMRFPGGIYAWKGLHEPVEAAQ